MVPRLERYDLDNISIGSRVERMGNTLRASNDLPSIRGDINTSDSLIMPSQFILKGKTRPRAFVELNFSIPRYSQERPVRTEGVVGNGLMKEGVNFGHDDADGDRSNTLLSLELRAWCGGLIDILVGGLN